MKKVLIIANLFYASPRIPGLAKYLPQFEWQPIILTTPLGSCPDERFGPSKDFRNSNRVIETFGYISQKDVEVKAGARRQLASRKYPKYVRSLLRFFYRHARALHSEVIHYPDAEKGWIPFALKAGDKLLQEEDIEAIISSSSPVTAHIIAKELKEKHNIPWVADFRDLWTQNHAYPYTRFRKMFETRLEIETLSSADIIVTTSSLWAEKLRILHKGKKTSIVTNGFDPEKMSDGKTSLTSKFTITYTGQIYAGRQDPSKPLLALKDLISHGSISASDVEVRFYGPEKKLLAEKIEQHGLSNVVRQYGVIPGETSLAMQRESQVLLLLNWEDPREKGVYTGKVFEYLAAQRPILATGGFGNDVLKMLLDETNSGIYCSTIEDIENTLRKLYLEYKKEGRIAYEGKIGKINKYSYREMARRFAEMLDSLTN